MGSRFIPPDLSLVDFINLILLDNTPKNAGLNGNSKREVAFMLRCPVGAYTINP